MSSDFFLELQRRQPRIKSARAHQFGMCPGFDNGAFIHDQDAVSLEHRRQTVSDDQCRPPRHQPVERRLHQALALRIERAGGFIEQQQRRIAQNSAGDGNPLPLTSGKADTALAELCGKTLGHALDELHRLRLLGRGTHRSVIGFWPAVADIFGDIRGKDGRLLRDEADPLA